MQELRKFESSTFDTVARRRLVEDQDTILELTGEIQELQSEINCMNDSKYFQDAESIRSGNSHVTSRPVSFPPHPIPEGREGPPSIWDTHGISGNVFANPDASSSAPYPQELNPWSSSIEEPLHSSTVEKSERQKPDQDLRCQSGPSAKDSVIFSGGRFSNNYGADPQRLQISDLHFDKFPTPGTFACWKIRFKTEVCTCSQIPTEAMLSCSTKVVSLYARRFGKGQWSFIGPFSEKKWYCISEDKFTRVWDKLAERMLVDFGEIGCPIFRATSSLSRGQLKSKGHGKLSIHCAADLETVETNFRIIVSANQLSLYGAVAEICEEYESLHERTGSPVVMGQSSSSLVLRSSCAL